MRMCFAVSFATIAAAWSGSAYAGEQFTFPSSSGVQIAAQEVHGFAHVSAGGSLSYGGTTVAMNRSVPPPPLVAYEAHGKDGSAYLLTTYALTNQSHANYAADYARLFQPGYAVTAWTGRVFGVVEAGYGAVDGWTAAAYDMERLPGGPRREMPPDLTRMPALQPHPELEQTPVFEGR
jgi:hypothetical protein